MTIGDFKKYIEDNQLTDDVLIKVFGLDRHIEDVDVDEISIDRVTNEILLIE